MDFFDQIIKEVESLFPSVINEFKQIFSRVVVTKVSKRMIEIDDNGNLESHWPQNFKFKMNGFDAETKLGHGWKVYDAISIKMD